MTRWEWKAMSGERASITRPADDDKDIIRVVLREIPSDKESQRIKLEGDGKLAEVDISVFSNYGMVFPG
ncbi:hypothetical protein HY732_03790 [Candidatus Uhrbacteria bacterium]|nr:hypothetical protein [Candidatus Uhrbacteria bacterium]